MNYKIFERTEEGTQLAHELINYLLDYNTKSSTDYYDIHIYEEEGIAVEWVSVDFKGDRLEGNFQHVDCDEQVMKELVFPDNSTTWVSCDREADELMEEWLAENPDWVKDDYGIYHQVFDNQ